MIVDRDTHAVLTTIYRVSSKSVGGAVFALTPRHICSNEEFVHFYHLHPCLKHYIHHHMYMVTNNKHEHNLLSSWICGLLSYINRMSVWRWRNNAVLYFHYSHLKQLSYIWICCSSLTRSIVLCDYVHNWLRWYNVYAILIRFMSLYTYSEHAAAPLQVNM